MRISLGYPSPEDEARVLVNDPRRTALKEMAPVVTTSELVEMQDAAAAVRVDGDARRATSFRSPPPPAAASASRSASAPRGSLALLRAAKAAAWMAGRDYLVPEDISRARRAGLRPPLRAPRGRLRLPERHRRARRCRSPRDRCVTRLGAALPPAAGVTLASLRSLLLLDRGLRGGGAPASGGAFRHCRHLGERARRGRPSKVRL